MRQRQPWQAHQIERAVFLVTVAALVAASWFNATCLAPVTQAGAQPAADSASQRNKATSAPAPDSSQTGAVPVHPLLQRLFVCITFKWNVDKIVYLDQVRHLCVWFV